MSSSKVVKKYVYLCAAGMGGIWIGKIVYATYAYIQLIIVNDFQVEGVFWFKVVGCVIGIMIGRYWQTSYRYWDIMSFSPLYTRK